MNIKSKEDIVRKRNQDLAAENEELKQQLVKIQERLDEILLSNDSSEIRKRIDQLEIIKKEWKSAVDDLNMQKEKYQNLIDDLQIVKDIMMKKGFKVPWFQKFFDQLQLNRS